MDKYLVKTPRPKSDGSQVQEVNKELKQATIGSLQGVVVIEDILFCKAKLSIPNQRTDVLIECLQKLNEKTPPRHVLVSTKIGHVVNKLRRHPDEDVVREARRVYTKWRGYIEKQKDRPQIEVKYDAKTEGMRLRGKTFLSDVLGVERSHSLIEALEREAFHQHKRLNSTFYRRTIRQMIFKLKHDENLRKAVLQGDISVEDFVHRHRK